MHKPVKVTHSLFLEVSLTAKKYGLLLPVCAPITQWLNTQLTILWPGFQIALLAQVDIKWQKMLLNYLVLTW